MENTKKTDRITVIGAAIIDVLAGPVSKQVFQTGSQPVEKTSLSFGGDALNEAVVLSRLGKKVQLISKVGKDEAGARVMDYAEVCGLATECIIQEEGLTTGINIVLLDEKGERHFLTNPQGSLRKLALEDILPYADAMGDVVSFASIFVSPLLDIPAMEQLFQKIKSVPGRILVADMTKAKNGERLEDIRCLLPYIDYILPNEDEMALLTGIRDSRKNAELLVEAGVGCAVVKCGAKGCIIATKEAVLEIPAYPIKKLVDTTGAGDCFAAGFLWGLSEGYSLADCGKMACAVASCGVEQVGATEGVVSLEECLKRFQGNV
ncbi:MAG: carbohydrate kinase family protein [Lachnospiraceae bacterium]|nr:carbohydrate kinase family protein [Lachnospiraceae bacterium]